MSIPQSVYVSHDELEDILVAGANMTWEPYASRVTIYTLPLTLAIGTQGGVIKKITNASGVTILVNCALEGPETQVSIPDNGNCTLIFIQQVAPGFWRLWDATGGVMLVP